MTDTSLKQMIVEIGVRTPMRDGVVLVSDLYRPAGEGRWPVILQRNGYDRTDPGMGSMVIVDPAWLARHGYVVIVQDTRGRGDSEGEFDVIYQEVDDAYDTIEWAAAQPWSAGAVGIYGSSYMGCTAYQAVASRAPHLRAAVAFAGKTSDMVDRLPGDIYDVTFNTWWALLTALTTIARMEADPETKSDLQGRVIAQMMDPVGTASKLPLSELDVLSDPKLSPFWLDILRGPEAVRPTGKRLLVDDPSIGDVALLHINGYRDFLAKTAFELATASAGSPKHRFIAGPWAHRGVYSGHTGARELPGTSSPAGPLGWGPLIAAWFDIHLRGGSSASHPLAYPWLEGDAVRYYVEGENRWASTPSWPPKTHAVEWRLTSGGSARSARGDGALLNPNKVPARDGSDSFRADPFDPFPTCGGALGIPEQGPDGIQDQRAVDHRDDVLIFSSEILSEPISIAGAQKLVLNFSSSAPDADICVTLVDVEPSGFAYNVSEGWQRTRYRNGAHSDWLEPGKIEEVAVVLHDTAHVFRAGHRIRVMIAGANFPHLSRNLHTKTVPEFAAASEAVVAEHTIHHGPSARSRLILNVIEL